MTDRSKEFVGHLMTFDKKGEGDEIVDENVLVEVTNATKDGEIEIAFNDRNERCYLQLNLPELLARIMANGVAES